MIRSLDVTTAPDATLDWMYELRRDCHLEVAPDEPDDGRLAVVGRLRHPPPSEATWHWTFGDPAVAYGSLSIGPGSRTGFGRIFVPAEHRRRGIGRSLFGAIEERARAASCAMLTAVHAGGDAEPFCDALGLLTGGRTVRSALTLPARAAGSPVPGYALRSWTGSAPEDLLDSFTRVRDAINDAPRDEGVDPDLWTPERVREVEQSAAGRGVDIHVTGVVDAQGELAAFTDVRLPHERGSSVAFTDDTAVLAEHRGRGLATWIKAESLRSLHRERPDVATVTTSNAETNAAMLAVNRRLGFVRVAVWTAVLRPLA